MKIGKKNVLLITQYFPPEKGGTQTLYHNFAKFWPNCSSRLSILTYKQRGSEHIDRELTGKVHRIHKWSEFTFRYDIRFFLGLISLFLESIYIVFKDNIGIIFCGNAMFMPLIVCFILNRFSKIPFVLLVTGEEIPLQEQKGRFLNYPEKHLIRRAAGIVTWSPFGKNRLTNQGIRNVPIAIMKPGVDTNIFHPLNNLDSLAKKLDTENKTVILTIARLDERKGHDMVIKAVPQVLHKKPNLIYLIIGKGPYEPQLKALVNSLGLNKYVEFLGEIASTEDIVRYYNVCDIFVHPNRELKSGDAEGFGLVFLEANACGKPVIGGRSGGTTEAIEHGNTGYLVNPCDVDDIASKILILLQDSSLYSEMSKKALKRVVESFTWDKKVLEIKNKIFLFAKGMHADC